MIRLLSGKLSHALIAMCCLVAMADFATTWLALTSNPLAAEQGFMASRAMGLGGFPTLLAADILFIGVLTCIAWVVYRRYRSNLAVALLLVPYICTGVIASVNNGGIAL
jgi:hypothetical protein